LQKILRGKRERTPIPLESLLDAAGLEHALWVLGAVEGHRNAVRLYACHCARRALVPFERQFPDKAGELREIVNTAEGRARGQATDADLAGARDVVWGMLNPDPDVHTDEDGNSRLDTQEFSFSEYWEKVGKKDSAFESALLAVLACTREEIGGGAWRAARDAKSALAGCAEKLLHKQFAVRQAVLRAALPAIADAVHPALAAMAADACKALAGHVSAPPSPEDLTRAIRRSILESGDSAVFPGYAEGMFLESMFLENFEALVEETVGEELACEFRRLCRLEGAYGEVV
jgi:hypothetical protein